MKKKYWHFLLFIFYFHTTLAQHEVSLGMPSLTNFSPTDYGHLGKIWAMSSADNGLLYLSCDAGLVEYDGQSWRLFKGSQGFTRSIYIANDSTIFTGSDLDFGMWSRDLFGKFHYQSLFPFKEEIGDISEEFWHVFPYGDGMAFISSQNIYIHQKDQLTKIQSPIQIAHCFLFENQLFFSNELGSLWYLDKYDLKKWLDSSPKNQSKILGLFRLNGNQFIVTQQAGIFKISDQQIIQIDNELSRDIRKAQVFSFQITDQEQMILGTVSSGAYIAQTDGRIIHHVNKQKGLLNNTVLSLHWSSHGKLWLGLDYGLSQLKIKNPLTYIIDYKGDFGTGRAAYIQDNLFYLGTNQGLFVSTLDDLDNANPAFDFQRVPGSEGQVWTIESVNGQLFMGHDLGLFKINGKSILKINSEKGIWSIIPFRDHLLIGTYNGIERLALINKSWQNLGKLDYILGSCNQLLLDAKENIWIRIPNFGFIKATLDENMQVINRNIFPQSDFSGNFFSLHAEDNEIIIISDSSKYVYNHNALNFEQIDTFLFRYNATGQLPDVLKPEKLSNDIYFIPTYNGFALLNRKEQQSNGHRAFEVIFRQVKAYKRDDIKELFKNSSVSYPYKNISFAWIAPNKDEVLYQYKLDNQTSWSELSSDNSVMLHQVKSGINHFQVRAWHNGFFSPISSFTFTITPPWYKSYPAFFLYLLIIIAIIYVLKMWKKRLLIKQEKVLREKELAARQEREQIHQKEIQELQQQALKSQNDELKQELKSKTIELAAKAKLNEDKIRLLTQLLDKIKMLAKNPAKNNIIWKETTQILENALQEEDKTFEIQIDSLHQEYFQKLKDTYPSLSRNDLRMCAYIRIGMDTKEIADMLNMQPSSAYISRSRLRKKLNLNIDEDLFEFLNKI